ncbi:MAG TPA: CvpA family protein, partial [Candidatus Wallbacteria bacterium]|nr:CvpA family protein [Candidatus Wallbacteria bacterium]
DLFGLANISAFLLSFAIICAFIYILLKVSKYLIEKKIAQSETMTQANKTAGMFAGFVKGALVALVVAIGIILMPFNKETRDNLDNSTFLTFAKIFKPYIINLFGDKELFEAAAKMSQSEPGANARAAESMASSKEFQKIVAHPKLQRFAQDAEIRALVEKQDVMGLMSNKKFLELMNDKEMMDLIRTVDVKRLLKDMNAGGKPGEGGVQMPDFEEVLKKTGAASGTPASTGGAANKGK